MLGLHFLQFGGILKKNMSSHFNLTGLVNVSHLRRYCVSHKPELRGENCLSEKGIPPSSFILELLPDEGAKEAGNEVFSH